MKILTWFWEQPGCRTKYTANHVNNWARMVRKHLTLPHTIACVTDIPEGIDSSVEIIAPPKDFENVRIPTWPEKRPQCLRRLAMFSPNAAEIFGDHFVCMDLDVVIGRSIDDLFTHGDDFRMFKGTGIRRPYNGSMLQMKAGARPDVYTKFTPQKAVEAGRQFLGSDQAWISYTLGWNEKTWSLKDGVTWYGQEPLSTDPACKIMFFPGALKPWQFTGPMPTDKWVAQHYPEPMEAA